jgi:Tol biopolymer transport system component
MARPVDEAAWSRDGAWLALRAGSGGGRDIYAVKVGADAEPIPLATSDADEYSPTISPDGRWLAYGSNGSGRDEIYVRSFPDQRGGRVQISTAGGSEPTWSHSGRELFYRDENQMLVAATLDVTGALRVVSRQRLFSTRPFYWDNRHRSYGVSSDSQSFYFVEPISTARSADVVIVLNWLQELRNIR